jgi:hypothetical protein
MVAVNDMIRQRGAEVIEAAHRAGLQPDDDLAILLANITSLAATVGDATAAAQWAEVLKRLDESVQRLCADMEKQEDDIKRVMLRAGLVVARQLAVRMERRTAMAIGAAAVLIAVIAGYTGYQIGAAGTGPIAACWQQAGKEVCAPAVWIGAAQR